MINNYREPEERLDALIDGAAQSGLTIDALEALTSGLSLQALRKVIGNASSMPAYRKSSDNPYLSRISNAPFKDSLDEPASQLE